MKDMRGYWLRILGAWLLLRIVSALVKDAEKLLTKTADTNQIISREERVARVASVIDGTATEATING